jgi:hypothetical protein
LKKSNRLDLEDKLEMLEQQVLEIHKKIEGLFGG